MHLLYSVVLGVLGKGTAPVHRKAIANAKCLGHQAPVTVPNRVVGGLSPPGYHTTGTL
jgi:hypothetical protein